MLRLLYFAFLALSHASDNSNLMQQAVSVETNRERIRSTTATIMEALAEVPQKGDMRQMAIDALMRSVEDATPATLPGIFDEIVGLLDNILAGLDSDAAAAFATLSVYVQISANCNMDNTSDAQDQANWETARDAHASARVDEYSAFLSQVAACSDMYTYIKQEVASEQTDPSVHAYKAYCLPNPAQLSNVDDWLSITIDWLDEWYPFVKDAYEYFTTTKATALAKKNSCFAADATLTAKEAESATAQAEAENKYCVWYNTRELKCLDLNTCHNNNIAAFEDATSTANGVSDDRVIFVKRILVIRCLVVVLRKGVLDGVEVTNQMVSDCQANATHDTVAQQYVTQIPTLHPQAVCENLQVYPNGDTNRALWFDILSNGFPPLNQSLRDDLSWATPRSGC